VDGTTARTTSLENEAQQVGTTLQRHSADLRVLQEETSACTNVLHTLEPRVVACEHAERELDTRCRDTDSKLHLTEDRLQRTMALELTALEERCEAQEERSKRTDSALGRLQDIVATIEVVARAGQNRSGEVDEKLERACRAIRAELTGVAGEVHKVGTNQDGLRHMLSDAQSELENYKQDCDRMLSKSTANLQAVRAMESRLATDRSFPGSPPLSPTVPSVVPKKSDRDSRWASPLQRS